MRIKSILMSAAILGFATTGNAYAAECFTTGRGSSWGVDAIITLSVSPNSSCMHGFSFGGVVEDADITRQPAHGHVIFLNISTIEYTAKGNYTGPDSFVIRATGKGPPGNGTSNLRVNVVVQ